MDRNMEVHALVCYSILRCLSSKPVVDLPHRARRNEMQWAVGLSLVSLLSAAVCIDGTAAEFNQCLGVEITQLPSIGGCGTVYAACLTGVEKLNEQLRMPVKSTLHPVSVVSATESKAKLTNETTIAMLLQLAPIDHCEESTTKKVTGGGSSRKCTFDMAQVELFSILLREAEAATWTLDGFKHHALPEEDRAQIVEEYKSGRFFGSNLAIGIFNTLPAESASDSSEKTFTRSPFGIFAVAASATVSIGLLFHQRRRFHNGYAPISMTKRGRLQAKSFRDDHFSDSAHVAKLPTAVAEELSLKQTNERFAV